jgi:uncharacterized protein
VGHFDLPIESLGEEAREFVFEANAGWWQARDPEPRETLCGVEEPFRLVFEARRVGEDVELAGQMQGRVALECSRCAKRYSHALCEDFRLVLEPAGSREPADPEGVAALAARGLWLGEDLEAGWFRGSRVRLDDFFGEVIALAMPLQPLCSEECPGICPHCGADRAEIRCACADEKVESPFAVLAKLKGVEGGASEPE